MWCRKCIWLLKLWLTNSGTLVDQKPAGFGMEQMRCKKGGVQREMGWRDENTHDQRKACGLRVCLCQACGGAKSDLGNDAACSCGAIHWG